MFTIHLDDEGNGYQQVNNNGTVAYIERDNEDYSVENLYYENDLNDNDVADNEFSIEDCKKICIIN